MIRTFTNKTSLDAFLDSLPPPVEDYDEEEYEGEPAPQIAIKIGTSYIRRLCVHNVHVSSIKLGFLPNLKFLCLEGVGLRSFSLKSKSLEVLNVNGNPLKYLRLRAPSLVELYASGTKLRSISRKAEKGLVIHEDFPRLEVLDVSCSFTVYNLSFDFDPSSFAPNLKELCGFGNVFTFKGNYPLLEKANLSRCEMKGWSSPMMPRIQRLNLSRSRFAFVDPQRLNLEYPTLRYLNISHALVSELTGSFPELVTLKGNNCHTLKTFGETTFPKLETMELEMVHLPAFPESLPMVKTIKFSGGEVQSLRGVYPQLRELELGNFYWLKTVDITSPNLETFHISGGYHTIETLIVRGSTPKLTYVYPPKHVQLGL